MDRALEVEAKATERGRRPLIRFVARENRPPLGAILGGLTLAFGAGVALLQLDRLPVVFCTFKGLTGRPCPTCGTTRALSRLVSLDLAGALAMNPLATAGALMLAGWALADLALLPRRRALGLEVHPRYVVAFRVGVVLLFLLNWVYLLANGR